MTHLPHNTTILKPGDTLTAAQCNALPVGSETSLGGLTFERLADGWACKETEAREMILYTDGHTLLRVGPPAPQFAVGQVVSREELDALPDGAVVYDNGNWGSPQRRTKQGGKWYHVDGSLHSPSPHWTFTIISLPSAAPACPHAVGTLAWARWMAKKEGKCVRVTKHDDFYEPHRWRDGKWQGLLIRDGKWRDCISTSIYNHPGPWSIVPDPSLPAETPVADVLQIDPAEIAATLDEAIPEWRNGMTVAQAVGELNLRIGLYQASDAELREKVEVLTAERDAAIARAEKAENMRDFNEGRLKAARDRAEKAEQLLTLRHAAWKPRVVVPEFALAYARSYRFVGGSEGEVARWILSLAADHLPDAGKMVHVGVDMATGPDRTVFTSAHPEGSGAWAIDAMKAGLGVEKDGRSQTPFIWRNGRIVDTEGCTRYISDVTTGWRIHQPTVAPEPLPSIAQLDVRLKAVETRLAKLEATR